MKKLVIAVAMALALSACSMRSENQPLEVWDNYKNEQINVENLQEGQALAVVYRQDNVKGAGINIYVNGDYQASLLENSFTALPICATKQHFSASFVTNQQFGNRTQGVHYILPVKQIIYLKMSNGKNGQPVFEQVNENIASKDLSLLKKVNQTLSRAKQHCENVVLKTVSFSAGALFGLNKSDYKDISIAGRKEISDFAEDVKAFDLTKISKIEVNGYTDPEGSDMYNLKLSEKRAKAVAAALKNAKVTSNIVARGYGESNLVVTDCYAIKNKTERAVCNQPNRRVEVTVYGNK